MSELKVALVTAASRGMGAACARELAARGYHLTLLARSPGIETLAAELDGIAVRGDVESEADLGRLVDVALERSGHIDVVVNNTGHAAKGDLLEISDHEWHRGLDLLLLNVVRMTRLVLPRMLERGAGAIVNVSSFSASEPGLRFPVSSVLRAGLGNFAKLFAQRFGAAGLRMNNVLPGWVDSHAVEREILSQLPAGRAGSPEEIAKAVAFLASDDASYVNGESLLVDGGLVRAV